MKKPMKNNSADQWLIKAIMQLGRYYAYHYLTLEIEGDWLCGKPVGGTNVSRRIDHEVERPKHKV